MMKKFILACLAEIFMLKPSPVYVRSKRHEQ
jgi:hypothetical protein